MWDLGLQQRRCPVLLYLPQTQESTVSRKDWRHDVCKSHGWDEEGRVTRVEFRYRSECLREMGVEEAYVFLDHLPQPMGVLHQAVAAAYRSQWRS